MVFCKLNPACPGGVFYFPTVYFQAASLCHSLQRQYSPQLLFLLLHNQWFIVNWCDATMLPCLLQLVTKLLLNNSCKCCFLFFFLISLLKLHTFEPVLTLIKKGRGIWPAEALTTYSGNTRKRCQFHTFAKVNDR
jgi:hypothetical protein